MGYLSDLDRRYEAGIFHENEAYARDYATVVSFLSLQSFPGVPTSWEWAYRSEDQSAKLLSALPSEFFAPLQSLLGLLGMSALALTLNGSSFLQWQDEALRQAVIERIEERLHDGTVPRLIPTLVATFRALAWDKPPGTGELDRTTVIVIPGGRNFDRATEALRMYEATEGRAYLLCTGKAPYWDPENSRINVTESEAAAAFWRMHGVPPGRILIEKETQNTLENAFFLKDTLFNQLPADRHTIVLITSPFHMARYRMNVTTYLGDSVDVFAKCTTSNRYTGAEYYFYSDPNVNYPREVLLKQVINEYAKIAFDLRAEVVIEAS